MFRRQFIRFSRTSVKLVLLLCIFVFLALGLLSVLEGQGQRGRGSGGTGSDLAFPIPPWRERLRLHLATDDEINKLVTVVENRSVKPEKVITGNERIHQRFWDLVKNNGSATSSLFETEELRDLWAPGKGQAALGPEVGSRLIPQLVWGMEAKLRNFSEKAKKKKILLWDSFQWWNKAVWSDPMPGDKIGCGITEGLTISDCEFTQKISEVGEVDAVIAARDFAHTGEVSVPENVLRFWFILESPFHSRVELDREKDLLSTYWRGSDVVTPYLKWAYKDPLVKGVKEDKDYSVGKSKPIAAFISNCHGWNDRLGFIRELQKHIQVDLYGACGDKVCPRRDKEDCFSLLKKDYYFYLSFENSNCRDYVTEKLYENGLKNDVVPIVMGAHPDDYRAMAPENSYIHIEDFPSPEALAKELKRLIKTPAEYNKYFEWKGAVEMLDSSFFCQICAMVHYADLVPPPNRLKAKGQKFSWGYGSALKTGMCLPRGRWYWGRDNKGNQLIKGNSSSNGEVETGDFTYWK